MGIMAVIQVKYVQGLNIGLNSGKLFQSVSKRIQVVLVKIDERPFYLNLTF